MSTSERFVNQIGSSESDEPSCDKSSKGKEIKKPSRKKLFRQCEQCDVKFPTAYGLLIHNRKVHATEKLYKCSQCPSSFLWESKLRRHEKIHELQISKESAEAYKCSSCPKIFSQPGHLKDHEILHANPDAFACPTCKKRFSRKCALQTHQLVHKSKVEKMRFECSFCSAKFTRFDVLNIHLRLHTGERPYKCDLFEMTFYDLAGLRYHQNRNKCPGRQNQIEIPKI